MYNMIKTSLGHKVALALREEELGKGSKVYIIFKKIKNRTYKKRTWQLRSVKGFV